MIIGNRVHVNASYQRYRASRADEVQEVSSIAAPNTRGADVVDAAAVHDGAPTAAETQGEEVVDSQIRSYSSLKKARERREVFIDPVRGTILEQT